MILVETPAFKSEIEWKSGSVRYAFDCMVCYKLLSCTQDLRIVECDSLFAHALFFLLLAEVHEWRFIYYQPRKWGI